MMDERDELVDQHERLKNFLEELKEFPRHPFSFLWRSQTLQGIIARRDMLGFRLKRDVPLVERLRRGILSSQFPRGSWKGSVGWTAYELWRLSHLGVQASHPKIVRAIEFVEAYQTSDGNFYERPTIPTVYQSLDGGEFTPGTFSLGFTAYVLLGLRKWRYEDEAYRRAVRWLVEKYLADGVCCIPCAVYMLVALADEETMEATIVRNEITLWLESLQRDDGIWNCDVSITFLVLYGLGSIQGELAMRQVKNSIPLLLSLQFEDGGWGRMGRAEKTLSVAMSLRRHRLIGEFLQRSKFYAERPRPINLLSELATSLDRFIMAV
ncbi:MAG: terpene cyclase/mutase family protein [Armatimonadota bacterium]|nr:terpene cyclase/mutase family protein [Armatimonadota bacterium]MCX7777657.1 terpene cyclase/mutase family protein [Armatimonadota bacterium]MDW8025903.1 terpene cyclase/mutase family protein [Armatimonadota bacterium]